MNQKIIPVLLTSSVVAHDTSVTLKDTNERIHFAVESIEHWLQIDPNIQLVLCDGSNFNFSSIVSEKFPSANIECLFFENDINLVKKNGRGYGEGEIIKYAINNSKLITNAKCFAKCTSKLWVDNYNQFLNEWNGVVLFKGVFLNVFSPFKKIVFSYIDTRFYIINCSLYKKYFENAHLNINIDLGHGLEDCFLEIYINLKINNSLFKNPPIICGVGGGIGINYKNSKKRIFKEIIRLKIVKLNKKFKNLLD